MGGVEGLRAALADRYAVEREVGHGAMATVYLAHDLRFDRDVAVKVLSPDLSAALGAERFLREIDVVAKLNHPHILPLLDSGNAGGFLYYVMPYVDGSLRNRLTKETQLRIDEAITLTREIALALDYAHQEGIVHRDVKPENILLSRGFALLADFGIARVLSPAEVERLTNTGASPGTPAYMSPEQCGGDGSLDGRSDLYSLGCVLYELLVGAPPFTGPTAQAIAARQLTDPVPPLRTVRRTVSEELERVVLQVLEKVPADRYATGAEFATALAAPALSVPRPWWRRLPKWKAVAALAAVGLGVYVAVTAITRFWSGLGAAGLDSTRYAILPFERDSGLASFNEDQLLQDAMLHWSGISVVDRPRMLEALPRSRARLTSSDAEAIARRVGAGRYVVSQVSMVGDSLRIHSAVYRTNARAPPIHESTAKVGPNRTQTNPAFLQIAERLLFGGKGPGASLDQLEGTISRPARQAFELGLDSTFGWNLTAADSAFSAATQYDPKFASAFVWLALVRSWSGAPAAAWRSAAERTAAGRGQLSSRDRLLSETLIAFGRGEVERACQLWERLTRLDEYDFAAWYGLGNCLREDDIVLPYRGSPSGWRFRSSYHRALRAFQRAFQLLPSIHKALRNESYRSLRLLLKTSTTDVRLGHSPPPAGETFLALPSWHGDSLAFVPFPARQFSEGQRRVVPATLGLAVRHQRELFHDIATAWVSAYPGSPGAIQALAISLEMLGDRSALDTLRHARALAATPGESLGIAGAEVWMRLKFSIPSDTTGIRAARRLADSLLGSNSSGSGSEPLLFASLAALTGRANVAARFSRQAAAAGDWPAPASIVAAAPALVTFAALGGPPDSVKVLEQQVQLGITNSISPSSQLGERMEWLVRPATLVFPDYVLASISTLAGNGDYLLDAQAAWLRGDTVKVRRVFIDLKGSRELIAPADRGLDALYPEARLLAAIENDSAAAAWLDPTINSLAATAPHAFADPVRTGALVRSMALRAELAERLGDHTTAKRWAKVVLMLWSDADQFLQSVVQKMVTLSE